MKRSHIFTIIIIAAVVVGWLVISRTGQEPTETTNAPTVKESQLEKAPNFSLQNYDGKTVNLLDFAGKSVVINSWASWCPFCRQEIPDFVTAQKEFGDKVVVILINRQESLSVAKDYTDRQGTSKDLTFLLDPKDSFYRSIGGFSMPETIFIDKNGDIVDHKRGPMDINEIRQKIQKIL